MQGPLLHEHSPAGYFKELLDSALARQHVTAGDLTAYYLVNLLCQFVRADASDDFGRGAEPLVFRLARALDTGGSAQRAQLRSLGDSSLFLCGFFADSFPRRTVDVDYYVSMGEYAYGSLSRRDRDACAEVFGELSRKFVGFMDVLSDVSEQTGSSSHDDALRVYERWIRTGSARDGRTLLKRGIMPHRQPGNRFIQ
jgi:hypothetical protein